MALSVVQTGTANSNSGTLIISFSATGANNLVVFGVDSSTTAGTVISVNDTAGNTYTKARGTAAQASSSEQWYGVQTVSGATKGTILFGGVPSTFGQMFEVSGAQLIPLDQTSSGTSNTGTALSVASLTPSVGSSIIIANGRQGGAQAWTAGANYTLGGTNANAFSEYRILSSNAAQTAPITGTQVAAWSMVAANYKAIAGAGTNLIQSSGTSGLGLSSISATWGANTTTGNMVVVGVAVTNAVTLGTVTSVTDTQGNTYQKAISAAGTAIKVVDSELWYATNITGGAGSVTVNNTLNAISIYAREYSGGFNVLDVTSSAVGSSTTINTGTTATTTAASELIIMSTADEQGGTQTYQASGDYGDTVGTTTTATGVSMSDNLVSSTGAQTGTQTMTVSDEWVSVLATFKLAATSAFVPRNMLLGIG